MVQAQAIQHVTAPQSLNPYSVGALVFALAATQNYLQSVPTEQFPPIFVKQEAVLGSFSVVKATQIAASNDGFELNDLLASVFTKLESSQMELEPELTGLIYKNRWSLYE